MPSSKTTGVVYFAVNGVSKQDWYSVEQLAETYSSVIPCFGFHPLFVKERSPNWFETLREYFDSTPSAAVGEIGVDKGSHGKKIDFSEQDAKSNQDMKLGREGERGRELGREKERERGRERRRVTDRDRRKERWSETDTAKTSIEVLRQQLELAKELNKPASVHCVCAFGDLLELMKSMGPFPAGVILHSYLGSAEMIDAPDALPMSNIDSLHFVEGDTSLTEELLAQTTTSSTSGSSLGNASHVLADASMLPKETLNHPANIHNVLDYVASVLEITKEELADLSYQNAVRLLSYKGSKVLQK
ncbi:hypothetical protein JHK87_045327 [Glycine soja]|nr:hypothetical protein JHK87_045327 [Glycine soja]